MEILNRNYIVTVSVQYKHFTAGKATFVFFKGRMRVMVFECMAGVILTVFRPLLYFLHLGHSLLLPRFIQNVYLILIVMKRWHEGCVKLLKVL